MAKIEIAGIDELLSMNLVIPPYQRAYKWDVHSVDELLRDIGNAINESKKYADEFKYRVGSIILYLNSESGELEIVDGQQRTITLLLLKKYICPDYDCEMLRKEFKDKTTRDNIQRNYTYIREWFALKENSKQDYFNALKDIVEVVVITVEKIPEAFQLFDSQNTRGKALDPHDLLKAYHLREMRNERYEMEHAVTKWEAKDTSSIRELFALYLFPVWNWSISRKTKSFTEKEIDTYKGITEETGYTYAKRTGRAMPYFQLTEPFIAGNEFFEMVNHYLILLKDIQNEIEMKEEFCKIREVINKQHVSTGYKYSKNLFLCVLLCYYDKFHNFDEMAIKKLFIWSFMIRVDMEVLSFDTINNYAIASENENYTNRKPMFSLIKLARVHSDIASLQIIVGKDDNSKMNEERKELNKILIEMGGLGIK